MSFSPKLFASIVGHVGAELAMGGSKAERSLEQRVRERIAGIPGLGEEERAAAFALVWKRMPPSRRMPADPTSGWMLASALADKYGFGSIQHLLFHLRQRLEASSGRLEPEPMEALRKLLRPHDTSIPAHEVAELAGLF